MNQLTHYPLTTHARHLGIAMFALLQLSSGMAQAQTTPIVANPSEAQALSQIVIPKSFTTPAVITNQGLQGAYASVPAPAHLAKVVLYRTPDDSKKTEEGLFVYLDGQLQTVLRPGGFTSFCMSPDQHTLDTTWGMREYVMPTKTKVMQNYESGKTYIFQASAAKGDGRLKPITEKSAREDLAKTQKQHHLVSRSPSALTCAD
jgi:hypothetical protein